MNQKYNQNSVDRKDLTVKLNTLSAADFIHLFRSPGWEAPGAKQVEAALKNSHSVFSLYSGPKLIGMGRLIGDRSMVYMFRDIVVLPEYQNQGAGTFLMETMLEWISHDLPAGWRSSCELFATEKAARFYQKFGFKSVPNQSLECGMMVMIEGSA